MRTTSVLVAAAIAIAPLQLHGQGLGPLQAEELRKAKDEVFVQVSGAERGVHGQLIGHSAESLTVMVDGREYRIPMASVLRIETMTRRFVDRGAAIGALVGLGVGACAFTFCGGQGLDGDENPMAIVLPQVGIGAAIGALSSRGARGLKTIYTAPGEVQPYSGPLPCPAAPLVVSAPLVVPDRAKWKSSGWLADYQSLGNARCDGVAIRRKNNDATGTWLSGVELKFKDSGNDVVTATARVTAQIAKPNRDKNAVVLIEILDGAGVLASSTAIIEAATFKEVSVEQKLSLSGTALAKAATPMLRLTITTNYD